MAKYWKNLIFKEIGQLDKNIFSQIKILIADDEPMAQIVMKHFLTELGCEVVVTNNGLEAQSLLIEEKFDVLLTDINMPKMNGIELAICIRNSNAPCRKMPIIGITADMSEEMQQKAKIARMNFLLEKSISQSAIKNIIKNIAMLNCKKGTDNIKPVIFDEFEALDPAFA